jgi:hypothetical protein
VGCLRATWAEAGRDKAISAPDNTVFENVEEIELGRVRRVVNMETSWRSVPIRVVECGRAPSELA